MIQGQIERKMFLQNVKLKGPSFFF